eukprot:CAMPEP_0182495008 /NCGR_PEP_ID=MMETSP1321-20130603/3828_1 /TAXON_ID=91990 /ORGANISM="Bolidomonas sp., Strain RCC1657" /LENGTH=34 /DNA_ID= /DNA_START= /DNA_END= /DNA_ORIENTATION=
MAAVPFTKTLWHKKSDSSRGESFPADSRSFNPSQ